MKSKKALIETYLKETEKIKSLPAPLKTENRKKYSHNRVFDEPESLKKLRTSARSLGAKQKNKIHDKKRDTQRGTNGSQMVHKRGTQKGTNGSQMDYRERNGSQKGHTKGHKNKLKGTQKEHKSGVGSTQNLKLSPTLSSASSLVGIQRKIALSIYRNCRSRGENLTQEMTLEHLSELAKVNKKSIKTTIKRLREKDCIFIGEHKAGRGGWVKYRLSKNLYLEFLEMEKEISDKTNGSQMVHKRDTQRGTQRGTSFSSSGCEFINTTTTEDKEKIKYEKDDLPDEWKKIDYDELKDFKFSRCHLIQLYRSGEHNPEIVQASIKHFAFDLANNKISQKINSSPLIYFMGIMRRSGIYTPPVNYETPAEAAIRIYQEHLRSVRKKKKEVENGFFEEELGIWLSGLTPEEREKLIPEGIKKVNFPLAEDTCLREHYRKMLWQDRWKEIKEAANAFGKNKVNDEN